MSHLQFAVRQLLKNPGFTGIAVLTLALGIGANTIVFSWVRAALIDAVPGANDAGRLVVLCPRHVSGRMLDTMSVLDSRDLEAETNIFAGITGSMYDAVTLRTGGQVDWVWAESTLANFFAVLQVKPELGRFFLPDEDKHPGADNVAVLSYGLWQRRFASDRNVLGRTIEIANRPFTIVGIAPANFQGGISGLRLDLWIPASVSPEFSNPTQAMSSRNWRFLHEYARLQPGVSRRRAQAAADAVMTRLEREYPATNQDTGVAVLPVWKSPWGGQSVLLPLLRALMAAAVLLLVLVAANIANLLLARATARQQEFAVRLALGAGRGNLLWQLMTENLMLAFWGGIAGVLVASWGVHLLPWLMPATYLPIGYNVELNGVVLGFNAAIALATGVLFGLVPALQSTQASLNASLREGGRSGAPAPRAHRLRSALVISEVALALVLLVGMTLCARSLDRARQIDMGLDPRHIWVAGFNLPPVGYDESRVRDLFRRLQTELAGLAGVEEAALADWLPLGFEGGNTAGFGVNGYQPAPGEPMSAKVSTVSPGYFRTLRIPILLGREFAERDTAQDPRVAIVNQVFADRYFEHRTPLGLKIRMWGQEWRVVGMARTGKYRSLNEPPQPFIYVSETQAPGRSFGAVIRVAGDPRSVAQAVERTAMAIDPLLKPTAALTMTQYTAAAMAMPRMAAILLAGLGAAAILLAAIGIYGVMSFSVSQRTREIGVRMALGASASHVLVMFIRQGMLLAMAGVAVGVAGGLAGAHVLSSLLVGVSASDPFTYGLVAALLAGIAMFACWLPARRATKIDPIVALRCE